MFLSCMMMKRKQPSLAMLASASTICPDLQVSSRADEVTELDTWFYTPWTEGFEVPDLQNARAVSLPFVWTCHQQTNAQEILSGHPSVYWWDGLQEVQPLCQPVGVQGFWLSCRCSGEYDQPALCLEEVKGPFYVFVNGTFAFFSPGHEGDAAFSLPGWLANEENRLDLLFMNNGVTSWLDGLDRFPAAGIRGSAWLQERIISLDLSWEIARDLESAKVWLVFNEGELLGQGETAQLTLQDPDEDVILEFETRSSNLELQLCDLHLWSPEKPLLYHLNLKVKDPDGAVLMTMNENFGLYHLENRAGSLRLNKMPFHLKGIHLPESTQVTSRHAAAVSNTHIVDEDADHLEEFVCSCKRNHVNSIYSSLPLTRRLMDLADQYGLFLIQEAPFHTHGEGGRPGFERQWRSLVHERLHHNWKALSVHPSLFAIHLLPSFFQGDLQMEMEEFYACQHRPLVLAAAGQPAAVCAFETLEKAKEHLLEQWDIMTFFAQPEKTVILSQDMEELERFPNFAGLFVIPKKKLLHGLLDEELFSLFSDLVILPDEKGVRIHNKSAFTSIDHVEFEWEMCKGHTILQKGFTSASVAPGAFRRLFLGWKPAEDQVRKRVTARYVKDMPYAKKGMPYAYGQNPAPDSLERFLQETPVSVVEGTQYTGIYGPDFKLVFDEEGLLSVISHGQEMLAGRITPVLYDRTEKKRGNALWMGATVCLDPPKLSRRTDRKAGFCILQYDYVLSTIPSSRLSVVYTVGQGGLMGIDMAFKGSSALPDLPYFGLSFPCTVPDDVVAESEQFVRPFVTKSHHNGAQNAFPEANANQTEAKSESNGPTENCGLADSSVTKKEQPAKGRSDPFSTLQASHLFTKTEIPAGPLPFELEVPEQLAEMEYLRDVWKAKLTLASGGLVFQKAQEPLRLQLIMREPTRKYPDGCLEVVCAPMDLSHLPNQMEHDAFKRSQFSFLLYPEASAAEVPVDLANQPHS